MWDPLVPISLMMATDCEGREGERVANILWYLSLELKKNNKKLPTVLNFISAHCLQ